MTRDAVARGTFVPPKLPSRLVHVDNCGQKWNKYGWILKFESDLVILVVVNDLPHYFVAQMANEPKYLDHSCQSDST